MYSSNKRKTPRFCAHGYEKSKDMATAALAYKCMEVAYLKVVYSSHNAASRDRSELQTVLQMVPPGNQSCSQSPLLLNRAFLYTWVNDDDCYVWHLCITNGNRSICGFYLFIYKLRTI